MPGTSLQSDFLEIEQPTDAAEARRLALARAAGLAFGENDAGRVGVVVTEIARNLIKHATRGDLFVRTLDERGAVGIEVMAVDRGPGIKDVGRSFRDGYSTAGTSGTGLGAVSRLSTACDVFSQGGRGTVLMAQVWRDRKAAPSNRFPAGAVTRPFPGETSCGDAWVVQEGPLGVRLLVADGLGHGENAAVASNMAVRTALDRPGDSPPLLLDRVHVALRATRGAAVAVAQIDTEKRVVRFAGVGNISAAVVPPAGPWQRMVSHNGTVGHQIRKVAEFTYPWREDCLLLMHSDGLSSNFGFDAYPGLAAHHPTVIAGVLYREFSRGRDDVSVVVLREDPKAN